MKHWMPKKTVSAVVLCLALLSPALGNAASDIFVYGCTSDGKPSRIKVTASIKDKGAIEAAFRRILRDKPSEWLLAQKRARNSPEWKSTLTDLERLSGGRLMKQGAGKVAGSISIGQTGASKRHYCGD